LVEQSEELAPPELVPLNDDHTFFKREGIGEVKYFSKIAKRKIKTTNW